MNLDYTIISELRKVLSTMKSLSIPDGKILNGAIRGKSADMSTAIITPTDAFSGFNMGISDCNLLLNRLTTFDDSATYTAELDDENNIKIMTIKKGRVKSIYTAANPKHIKAPSKVDFAAMASFTLTCDDIAIIKSTANTVHDSKIHLKSDGTKIFWYNGDASSDTVVIEAIDGTTTLPFGFKYEMKPILSILRLLNDTTTVHVSDKGFLQIEVDGLTTISLPFMG